MFMHTWHIVYDIAIIIWQFEEHIFIHTELKIWHYSATIIMC